MNAERFTEVSERWAAAGLEDCRPVKLRTIECNGPLDVLVFKARNALSSQATHMYEDDYWQQGVDSMIDYSRKRQTLKCVDCGDDSKFDDYDGAARCGEHHQHIPECQCGHRHWPNCNPGLQVTRHG